MRKSASKTTKTGVGPSSLLKAPRSARLPLLSPFGPLCPPASSSPTSTYDPPVNLDQHTDPISDRSSSTGSWRHQKALSPSSPGSGSPPMPVPLLEADAETGTEDTGDDTASEWSPNEPVTPSSGRQSQDFDTTDLHFDDMPHAHQDTNGVAASTLSGFSQHANATNNTKHKPKPDRLAHTDDSLPDKTSKLPLPSPHAPTMDPSTKTSVAKSLTNSIAGSEESATPSTKQSRSSGLNSTIRRMGTSFRRTQSNITAVDVQSFREATGYDGTLDIDSTLQDTHRHSHIFRAHGQDHRDVVTDHRDVVTDPSNNVSSAEPESPAEMARASENHGMRATMPVAEDFLANSTKRTTTGLSLRGRLFGTNRKKAQGQRRVRSVERRPQPVGVHALTRQPWGMPAATGAGLKSRRLSMSLPDDFTIDIVELTKEFEFASKLGRHGRHVGKGATSTVTLMYRKGLPSELYAVKVYRTRKSDETPEEYEKKIKSEFSIAKSLRHPNIVASERLCMDKGRWNHVMEYCSEGDLFSVVAKNYLKAAERETDRLCLFKQMVQGVHYLHSHGIAHRDLKLENLLLTKDSKLKITDFGVSEVFSGIHPGLREAGGECGKDMGEVRLCKPGICGSMPYIAPEVISKKADYDPRAVDVWSSAIIMIHLIFGASLWDKAEDAATPQQQSIYDQLASGWQRLNAKRANDPQANMDMYPSVAAFQLVKPLPLRRLLLNMLNPDPVQRYSMADVATNRWMKTVECCQSDSFDDGPAQTIDASKKDWTNGNGKIHCHNHLPLQSAGTGLPPMPGKPGY